MIFGVGGGVRMVWVFCVSGMVWSGEGRQEVRDRRRLED